MVYHASLGQQLLEPKTNMMNYDLLVSSKHFHSKQHLRPKCVYTVINHFEFPGRETLYLLKSEQSTLTYSWPQTLT